MKSSRIGSSLDSMFRESGELEDVKAIARERDAAMRLCSICRKPAACFGRYDNMKTAAYACNDCCGHGCEDGWCRPVVDRPRERGLDAADVAKLGYSRMGRPKW